MAKTYYIGGSPCSGKSTIAEIIVSKYGFKYYKLDDHLDEYTEKGKKQGKSLLSKITNMSVDDIWLRNPHEQNVEELGIYNEMFEYVLTDLSIMDGNVPIIAEGAGFLPELVKSIGVKSDSYICIVPTKEFQYSKYKERPWIPHVLEGCKDKKLAFENWMERDALFAESVSKNAAKLGYKTIVVDGTMGIIENLSIIEKTFELRC